jgi:UDP-N-acetylmuramoylalanine--D-glutamate ligase
MNTASTFDIRKKTLIVGLGKTGISCARFLADHNGMFSVTDSRKDPPGLEYLREHLPDVVVYTGGFRRDAFDAAEQLLISPGVSRHEPMIDGTIKRGIPVMGDIEVFAGQVSSPVIAITGSNGKSTVTSMVADMARQSGVNARVGGNLGTPALDLIDEDEAPELYILELSSFQLESTFSLNAVAAVVLNVSEDHMDRYQDIDSYSAAKQRIYHGDGIKVINADDPRVTAMVKPGDRVVRFTLQPPAEGEFGVCHDDTSAWLCKGSMKLIAVDQLRVVGQHNTANALAALALGEAVGFSFADMTAALKEFRGLPHRCQWLKQAGGVNWYNDSKATNVGAMLASVGGMPGNIVLIAGGDGKGADFTPLRDALAGKVKAMILLGRDADRIAASVNGAIPSIRVGDMHEAVARAMQAASPGDSVMLSPACASFDMYRNFEERGEDFMQIVEEIV